jgi:hypothetical protein
MTRDGQAILAAIVIMGFLIALTLERIAKAIEKQNQKPIGKSAEAEELSDVAFVLRQIHCDLCELRPKRNEPVDPEKIKRIHVEMRQGQQEIRRVTIKQMQKAAEFLDNLGEVKL